MYVIAAAQGFLTVSDISCEIRTSCKKRAILTFNHGVQGSNPCGLTTLAETTDHRVTPGVTARRPRAGAAAAVGALFSAGYRGRLLTLSGALADDRGGTGFEAHGHDGRQLVEVLLKHGVRINEDGVFFVRKPRR